MSNITLSLPEDLAKRIEPLRWLPTIIEIRLLAFKTSAAQTADEVIEFLAMNPSARDVHTYRPSDVAQTRMTALLERNREGLITNDELKELDELIKLEQVLLLLKAGIPSLAFNQAPIHPSSAPSAP
jgi:hypothetical protein